MKDTEATFTIDPQMVRAPNNDCRIDCFYKIRFRLIIIATVILNYNFSFNETDDNHAIHFPLIDVMILTLLVKQAVNLRKINRFTLQH